MGGGYRRWSGGKGGREGMGELRKGKRGVGVGELGVYKWDLEGERGGGFKGFFLPLPSRWVYGKTPAFDKSKI